MNEVIFASGIGAVCGSRSMLGPALVAPRLLPVSGQRWLALMAVGEAMADKSSLIPPRTEPLPLAGRMMMGALAAAVSAPPARRWRAAVIGAAAAGAATYAWYHLRRLATEHGVPNVAAGLMEDALALGAGSLLTRA